MTEPTALAGLRSAYLLGVPVVVAELPVETGRLVARTATGDAIVGELGGGAGTLRSLPVGTHSIEAWSEAGALLAEDFTSIQEHPGDDPIMGFATSFDASSVPSVLDWLTALRCTVVQVYDWMARYSAPLPREPSYLDPLGRPLERPALEQLIGGIKSLGAVAQAYAPVYAADDDFAGSHPAQRLYRGDGEPQSLGDLLQIMDPSNAEWQRHWLEAYGGACDELGFNGLHLDTYGYPRCALDLEGNAVLLDTAYRSFVDAVRAARPNDTISFNQVNGVPRGFQPPSRPGFRYVEVWPPNDGWRHFEALLQRSSGSGSRQGDTLAVYPPAWEGERASALRTALLTEAVAVSLGAGTLIWGDDHGALKHPYYVNHERLSREEAALVLTWHRFGLRCRDLFRRGIDTSWFDVGDENGAVIVDADLTPSVEPVGGSLFVRVVRSDDTIAVSLLDLSGSASGSWRAGSGPGRATRADVTILVEDPCGWTAESAVLGQDDGRFASTDTVESKHREGRAVSCRVPLVSGWSVLRLSRDVRRSSTG